MNHSPFCGKPTGAMISQNLSVLPLNLLHLFQKFITL